MSVRLFVCLIFITNIIANDSAAPKYGDTSKKETNRQGNERIVVTDHLNDAPDGGTQTQSVVTVNKTSTIVNNITIVTQTKEEDKNKTVTTQKKEKEKNETVTTQIKKEEKNETVTKKPDKEEMETQSSQTVYSYPPYKITEDVIDIPDDRTLPGPIVPDYTVKPSLNLANLSIIPGKPTRNHSKPDDSKPTKRNRLSILHIHAEFDDKKHETDENKVGGFWKGAKEYFHSIHRGVVNGLHSFFNKHPHPHEHDEKNERVIGK